MGNTSLETAEKHRGEQAMATVLDQLIQALTIVGARAETEKAAVDTARIDAEVTSCTCTVLAFNVPKKPCVVVWLASTRISHGTRAQVRTSGRQWEKADGPGRSWSDGQ